MMIATALLTGCCHVPQQPIGDTSTIELQVVRTFHAPITVNINGGFTFFGEPTDAAITAEVYSGKGGYDWGRVDRTETKKITTARFQDLWLQATNLNFNMALRGHDGMISDGSTWTLTIRKINGSSIVLCLRCPVDSEDPDVKRFVTVCDCILQLVDIEIPKDEKY